MVAVSVRGAVGQILLDRPRAMNAVTAELGRQLEQALVELAPRVSVIVIRGAGGTFSVGGDFKELERLTAEGPEATARLFDAFRGACTAVGTVEVPVIAAVEGYAMAGGFELMQAADVALVTETAELADNHLNFAQIPGGGGSQRLPRLVGRQRALAHILTGDRLSGRDAVAWGLAYRAYPAAVFAAAVDAFADRMVAKDRGALVAAKRVVRAGLERPLEEGLLLERAAVLEHLTGSSAERGIRSFTGARS